MDDIRLLTNMISPESRITITQPLNGLSGGEHQGVLGMSDLAGHQVQGVPDLGPRVGDDRRAGVVLGQNDWRWSLLSLTYWSNCSTGRTRVNRLQTLKPTEVTSFYLQYFPNLRPDFIGFPQQFQTASRGLRVGVRRFIFAEGWRELLEDFDPDEIDEDHRGKTGRT